MSNQSLSFCDKFQEALKRYRVFEAHASKFNIFGPGARMTNTELHPDAMSALKDFEDSVDGYITLGNGNKIDFAMRSCEEQDGHWHTFTIKEWKEGYPNTEWSRLERKQASGENEGKLFIQAYFWNNKLVRYGIAVRSDLVNYIQTCQLEVVRGITVSEFFEPIPTKFLAVDWRMMAAKKQYRCTSLDVMKDQAIHKERTNDIMKYAAKRYREFLRQGK